MRRGCRQAYFPIIVPDPAPQRGRELRRGPLLQLPEGRFAHHRAGVPRQRAHQGHQNTQLQWENTLTFDRTFGTDHHLTALVGSTALRYRIEQVIGSIASNLPAGYGAADIGRVTKGAALTLLAKAQLYQKNYAASLAASEQALGLGYSLVQDYHSMFRIRGENGPESIFEVQCTTLPGNCDTSNSY